MTAMRRPAVFFDRDNTLIVGHDYLGDPNGVVLVGGADAAVARCREMGFATVVVSNQSGVARGMFDEDAVRACNKRMDDLLQAGNAGAVIDRHEFCPFHPDAKIEAYRQDSFLRKPKPGMILAAADAMAIDLARSWVIGDAPRDVAAGKAAGCRTVLIVDPSLTPSSAAFEQAQTPADFTVASLPEAVETISRQINKSAQPAEPTPPPAKPMSEPPLASPPPGVLVRPSATPNLKSAMERSTLQAKPAAPAAAASTAASAEKPSTTAASGPTAPPSFVDRAPLSPANPPPRPPRADGPRGQPPQPAMAQAGKFEPANIRVQVDTSRLEMASQQLLLEVKKLTDQRTDDFSISKLIAGVVQVLALSAMLMAYFFFRNDPAALQSWLLTGVFLQMFTIALLIMSRQR